MKYAVRDRPIEQFNTELKLPEWQLEPDDEQMYGDPDDYYYIDEGGNLIEPQRPASGVPGQGQDPFPANGEQGGPGPALPPARRPQPSDEGTQAASDDFLNSATGGSGAPPPPPRLRVPAPQPTASQRPPF